MATLPLPPPMHPSLQVRGKLTYKAAPQTAAVMGWWHIRQVLARVLALQGLQLKCMACTKLVTERPW